MLHHVLTHTVSILSAFFFMGVAPALVAIRVRPSDNEVETEDLA
jgi:hypothetical protein